LASVLAQGAQAAEAPVISPARSAAEAGLVEIRSLVPDIALDVRYATADNFTGERVPGYERPACFLLPQAAEALARVEHRLRSEGHALRIYDCYRPVRSVQAFVAWARDPGATSRQALQYPGVDKARLFADGYIAEHSGHSRAATVDVGLMRCEGEGDGARCAVLDMGTDFDFFGPAAHTAADGLTPVQRANRGRLLQAMAAAGFVNYPQEWWHYTLQPEPSPRVAFDVPVE